MVPHDNPPGIGNPGRSNSVNYDEYCRLKERLGDRSDITILVTGKVVVVVIIPPPP